jgi:hypothetical protein
MSTQFDKKALTTVVCVVVSLTAGFFLRDVHATRGRKKSQESQGRLEQDEAALKGREESLEAREKTLESMLKALEKREAEVAVKEELTKAHGADLENREASIRAKEQELMELDNALRERQVVQSSSTLLEAATSETIETVEVEPEKDKRRRMIAEELKSIVKQVEDEELDDDLEPEALEALEKASMTICLRKKYYDVMRDELIYFPSVCKAILNGDLIDEATKYYYDEEDEFPLVYCAALKSIAMVSMSKETADLDEEYMSKLALDVEI